jgi:hypothetical protein
MPVVFLQEVNITDFLEVEGNVKVDSTGYLQLPVGTTAQRPTPQLGMIRYNSTNGKVEAYVQGEKVNEWVDLH